MHASWVPGLGLVTEGSLTKPPTCQAGDKQGADDDVILPQSVSTGGHTLSQASHGLPAFLHGT